MVSKLIEGIEENMRSILDSPVKKFIDKGKQVVSTVSEEISKKKSCVEEKMESVQDLNF